MGKANQVFKSAKKAPKPMRRFSMMNFIVFATGWLVKSRSKNINMAVIVATPIKMFSSPNITANIIIKAMIFIKKLC